MDEYDRGYYDALKWVYDHTGGDNYKLSVKAKMQDIVDFTKQSDNNIKWK